MPDSPKKPYHQMTREEQVAARILANRRIEAKVARVLQQKQWANAIKRAKQLRKAFQELLEMIPEKDRAELIEIYQQCIEPLERTQ